MRIGLRIFLGFFLIVGLAAFFVMRVFVAEVKPGVRQAMEATLIDTANTLAVLAAPELASREIGHGRLAHAVAELKRRPIEADVSGVRKASFDYRIYVTDARGIVVYDSEGKDVGADYSQWNDVYLTLRGEYGARSSPSGPDAGASSVMHVAAPVRYEGRIIGVLTVAKDNRHTEPFIAASQRAILRQGWLLLGLSFLIGLVVTWRLARIVDRLHKYAAAVAAGERAVLPPLGGSELSELGRSLETMRAKLEGKQYVEQYVQTLAHEMKSPLAALRGAAEILEGDPPEAERKRFAGHVGAQSKRLAGMIDKMLALAAVEHRQVLEVREAVDLGAIVAEALEALHTRFDQRGVAWSLSLPENEAATVRGDPFLLGQAVANLLDNALEFSAAGGAVDVSVELGDMARVRVLDRGPGVPDFATERVFERFYSLPRPDGNRSSGLGLAFVHEVATLHGGRATLANRADGGAEASLELPPA
jgi:two-component system sensor histidine kinase CreC